MILSTAMHSLIKLPFDRISKLEFLDEIEELDLVLAHYAISWGLFLENSGSSAIWGAWGLTQKRE
jgi:[phosphatase 2A protein]-leucine-carboxy methyltransferase